ncbi:MAG: hypothetical protein Q4E67_03570 [Planctomycetia bacterium]|nr:hypothetical protein [Planctomycetia bacterium]
MGYDFVTVNEGTEEEPFLVITTPNWVAGDATKEQDFRIYFENKSSATAAAQEVFVTTTLPEELDWSTFELREICIGNQVFDDTIGYMDGVWTVNQTSTGDQIKISVTFNEDTGEAKWYLRSWVASTADNFPTSAYEGFLPPNDKEKHDGEGYVAFAIRMDEDLATGTRIETNASIVFDTNEPIVTNTWVTTIDADKPVAEIKSATRTEGGWEVTWDGSDKGCGIAAWGIFVSINGAEEVHWKTFGASTKSAIYKVAGDDTNTYEFRVVAVDYVRLAEIPSISSDSGLKMVLQKDSHDYTTANATDAMPDSVVMISDWDSFYGEMWSEGVNVQKAGDSVSVKVTYDPKLFVIEELRNVPKGIEGTISDGKTGADGNVTVEVTFTVGGSDFTANGANTFWGSIYFTPAQTEGSGVSGLMTTEPVGILVNQQAVEAEVEALPYDMNRDHHINITDLIAFAKLFGNSIAENERSAQADYNKDGYVNIKDLILFAKNFGLKKGDSGVVVPETRSNNILQVVEISEDTESEPLKTSVAAEPLPVVAMALNVEKEPADVSTTLTNSSVNLTEVLFPWEDEEVAISLLATQYEPVVSASVMPSAVDEVFQEDDFLAWDVPTVQDPVEPLFSNDPLEWKRLRVGK